MLTTNYNFSEISRSTPPPTTNESPLYLQNGLSKEQLVQNEKNEANHSEPLLAEHNRLVFATKKIIQRKFKGYYENPEDSAFFKEKIKKIDWKLAELQRFEVFAEANWEKTTNYKVELASAKIEIAVTQRVFIGFL